MDLATDARQRTEGIGEVDRNPFVPHVTLGRFRRPTDVRARLDGVPVPEERFTLDRADLMASELTPDGPEYQVLRSWLLG